MVSVREAVNKIGGTRTDAGYLIDPDRILIDDKWRGRHFPPSRASIERLAYSIFHEGQVQAVTCMLQPAGRGGIEMVAGFTRAAAIRMIRRGFWYFTPSPEDDGPDEAVAVTDDNGKPVLGGDGEQLYGVYVHDAERRLLCNVVSPMSDLERLKLNQTENEFRTEGSIMDKALNARKMKEAGASLKDIANVIGFPPKGGPVQVSRIIQFCALPEKAQLLLHNGLITQADAFKLLQLEDERKRDAIVDKGLKKLESLDPREVSRAFDVGEALREVTQDEVEEIEADDSLTEEEKEAKVAKAEDSSSQDAKPLSMAQIKAYWQSFDDPEIWQGFTPEQSGLLMGFAKDSLKFITQAGAKGPLKVRVNRNGELIGNYTPDQYFQALLDLLAAWAPIAEDEPEETEETGETEE